MSVVLKDIDYNKRKENEYEKINVEMYTVSKYRDIAKKCISLFSGPSFSQNMIRDEDAISHVAEHIMWGHMRWKDGAGRTLKSYLNQCGIWAIQSWKTKIYNSSKLKISSLNTAIGNDGEKQTSHQDLISDKKSKEPFDILFNNSKDKAQKIIAAKFLTSLQKRCLSSRYIDGKKLVEIADELGVTRQAVNQHIKKAINKLRKHNGICE
mgnify:FL=1